MTPKITLCLALVLSGLASGGCSTSANFPNRSSKAAQGPFNYSTNTDGVTATIMRYMGASGALIIPSNINGLAVTSIGSRAFWAAPVVTSVVIPDSVTNIGEEAFSAVDSHSSLTNIVLGNGIIGIGRGAFHFCDKLSSIKIPKNVASIGRLAFGGCFGLKSIIVDSNNTAYSSVDGVLFNKNKTELVQYPAGKAGNYAIPNTVTKIADYALWNCPKLTGITIPVGVTTIKKEAFAACSSLTSVTLSASVTNIEIWAFDSCVSLKGVYFRGNAPGHGEYHGYKGIDIYHAFDGDSKAIVYYLPGTTGWEKTFGGCPTALWKP